MRPSKIGRVKRAWLLLGVLAIGCVERELVVKPDPEDAAVFIDGEEIALVNSAAVYRYEHYGIHRVLVRKPGYAVQERLVTLDPPWYQVFPIDFVADVLWPAKIEDRREIAVKLERRADLDAQKPSGKEVIERARAFSDEAKKP